MNKESALGNGSMLVYLNGSEISEIYADGYTSASFLGVSSEFDDIYDHSESRRISKTATFKHSIFSKIYHNFAGGDRIKKVIEDIRMIDVISVTNDTFVRYCENIRPFTLKLNIPPYVRKSFYKGYPIGRKNCDALCLVIPKGIPFYKSEATVKETRILVAVHGDAKFASDGCSIYIYSGSSRIIFASGDGKECVKNASKALEDGSYFEDASQIARQSELYWQNILSRTQSDAAEDALVLLVSHQTKEGGVISSHGEPIIKTEAIKDIVRAFLKFDLSDRALKALGFFCKRFDKDKTFYQIYGNFDTQKEEYFSNYSLGCARLMSAMLDYAQCTGDTGFIRENLAMLRSAMYAQLNEISRGMMPFSGIESEISDEILGVGVQLHGSLEATVEAACAILRFVKFCNEQSFKLPNDNGSAERRANAMLESVKEYFIQEKRVSLNAPEREVRIKSPRFAYGDCDVCRHNLSHIYYGELERNEHGVYICPSCYSLECDDGFKVRKEKCFLPQATAVLLSEKTVRNLLGEERTLELLLFALEERKENKLARSVVSDMIFLSLASEFSMDEQKEFLEKSIAMDVVGNDFPRTIRGKYVIGRLDTKTAAQFLCLSQ